MKRILLGAATAAALLSGVPAFGQTYQDSGGTIVRGIVPIQPGVGPLFTPSNPGKISGSFSASLSGFQPTPAYSQLAVAATSSRVALPSGSVIIVYNTGANAAFVTLGGSTAIATVGNDVVPAGGWMAFTVGPNTFLAAIETAGTTSLNISGGAGLPTGAAAGGGGGGGSNASVGAIGSPAPGSATYNGANTGGNLTGIIQAGASVPINISTATTTQLVAGVSGKAIYVTAWDVIAAGTTNFTFEYGTGSNCAVGTTALTGAYGLVAQFGAAKGGGLGPVLVVPAGNALCAVNSAAIQVSGSLAYTQF
jgi:hypothetical protein